MKRISLYGDMEDDDADYIEATFFASQDADYLTKRELLQHCSKLREQKEAYERKHKTFWSEERKQSWLK